MQLRFLMFRTAEMITIPRPAERSRGFAFGLQACPPLSIFESLDSCFGCALLCPWRVHYFKSLATLHDPSRSFAQLLHEWGVVHLDRLDGRGWACYIASCFCTPFQNLGMGFWNKIEGSTDSLSQPAHVKQRKIRRVPPPRPV